MRHWLILVFPWLAIRRIRRLTEQDYQPAEWTPWDAGYERALWEVRFNLGLEKPPA